MKTILCAVGAFLISGTAFAQTTSTTSTRSTTGTTNQSDTTSNHNPVVKDSDPAHTTVAADGANSFTEDQARARLATAGYANVTKLTKDSKGVWRGTAAKGTTKVQVGLDYKGNVTTR